MPPINILERLPWDVISRVVGFLPTQDFVSLMLVNKEHYRKLYDEFLRAYLAFPKTRRGATGTWCGSTSTPSAYQLSPSSIPTPSYSTFCTSETNVVDHIGKG